MKIDMRVVGALLLSGSLLAAEAVQPLEAFHLGKAGETKTGTFNVTNTLSGEVEVVLSISNLPSPGAEAALPEGNWINVKGPTTFRLTAGASRPIRYNVTFPPAFDKQTDGSILLVMRNPGDSIAPPKLSQAYSVHLLPIRQNANLKMALELPTMRLTAATMEAEGPRRVEVSVMVRNDGDGPIGPRGQVILRSSGQALETLPLQGTQAIPPGGQASYYAMGTTTKWPSGNYEAFVTFDYGDAYGQPLKIEKTYTFRVEGSVISIQPGMPTPPKVTPR